MSLVDIFSNKSWISEVEEQKKSVKQINRCIVKSLGGQVRAQGHILVPKIIYQKTHSGIQILALLPRRILHFSRSIKAVNMIVRFDSEATRNLLYSRNVVFTSFENHFFFRTYLVARPKLPFLRVSWLCQWAVQCLFWRTRPPPFPS